MTEPLTSTETDLWLFGYGYALLTRFFYLLQLTRIANTAALSGNRHRIMVSCTVVDIWGAV